MLTAVMSILAITNGLIIVTSRVFNAKVGEYVSGAGASFWNHLTGFLFLIIILPMTTNLGQIQLSGLPFYIFLGGLIGAGYVAINSFLFPKVGTTKATVLIIAGQIFLGTMIDFWNGKINNFAITLVGIGLIVIGMWIGNYKKEAVVMAKAGD